jgi:hypothetical protein
MPGHFSRRLKSGDSGRKIRELTGESADTRQLSRRKMKDTKTGNNSISQVSETDTHEVFTDYDAVELFNKLLLKKRQRPDP